MKLDLRGKLVADSNADSLFQVLRSKCLNLRVLEVVAERMTIVSLAGLSQLLDLSHHPRTPYVKELAVQGKFSGSHYPHGQRLESAIRSNGMLVRLNLAASDISDDLARLICRGFAENPSNSLRDFSLARNPITSFMLPHLARLIERCSNLETLHLDFCEQLLYNTNFEEDLDESRYLAFSNALAEHGTLTHLGMQFCGVTNKMGRLLFFGETLEKNKVLKRLVIAHSPLDTTECGLTSALPRMRGLRSLVVEAIMTRDCPAFQKAMRQNTSLFQIDESIRDGVGNMFEDVFARNRLLNCKIPLFLGQENRDKVNCISWPLFAELLMANHAAENQGMSALYALVCGTHAKIVSWL